MAYTRSTQVDPAPGGDTVKSAILDLDADLTAAFAGLNAEETARGLKAPIASPTFTGVVTIPAGASIDGFAPLASPALTGTPTAPTAAVGTATTQLATCALVASTAFVAALPGQTGNAGKFVTTDGENASWTAIPDTRPFADNEVLAQSHAIALSL